MTLDPLEIALTHADYRDWFRAADKERKRLDDKWYDIETNYFRRGNDHHAAYQREVELVDLKCDLLGLKYATQAAMQLFAELRYEMPIAGA
jgi:hypothetical protein